MCVRADDMTIKESCMAMACLSPYPGRDVGSEGIFWSQWVLQSGYESNHTLMRQSGQKFGLRLN